VTEREELARIIDPSSWLVLDSYLAEVKRKHPNSGYDPDNFKDRESLAKADQWLSRPSPVDGLKASLDEATSATMMAEMRADKLMAEVERLKGVTSMSLLSRLSDAEADFATATNSLSDMMALQMKTAAENARLREVLIWVREFAAMRGTDPESVFKKVARDALKTIAVKARNALTGDLTNG
jgi:hypothetical protein